MLQGTFTLSVLYFRYPVQHFGGERRKFGYGSRA